MTVDGAWPGQQGNAQGDDADVLLGLALFLFFRRGACARAAGLQHLPPDAEQDDAARDAERLGGDAEHAKDERAQQPEAREHHERREQRPAQHGRAVGGAVAARVGDVDGHGRHRVHHHQDGAERQQRESEQFRHGLRRVGGDSIPASWRPARRMASGCASSRTVPRGASESRARGGQGEDSRRGASTEPERVNPPLGKPEAPSRLARARRTRLQPIAGESSAESCPVQPGRSPGGAPRTPALARARSVGEGRHRVFIAANSFARPAGIRQGPRLQPRAWIWRHMVRGRCG